MDLRDRHLTPRQIRELHRFIRRRKLGYQPFVFTDTLEVGEGHKFRTESSRPGRGPSTGSITRRMFATS